MKSAKNFIHFTFLLAFAVCVSAQDKTPKIVWKNLQEKYESFYDIKPIIKNESDQPIYYDCSYEYADQTEDIRLLRFDEKYNYWSENVFYCGNKSQQQKKEESEKTKNLRKLVRAGKYIPDGCKINPNEEISLVNESQMKILVWGDGLIDPYKFGKFKIRFRYHWATSLDYGNSESSEFFIMPKEETK